MKQWVQFDDLPKVTQGDIIGEIEDRFDVYRAEDDLAGLVKPPIFLLHDMPIRSITGYRRNPSSSVVKKYVKMLDAGREAPPILVDGRKFIDGGHRFAAYVQAGRKTIPVVDVGRLLKLWPEWTQGRANELERVAQIAEAIYRDAMSRRVMAGFFEPPPKMVDDIVKWLLALVAYRYRLHLLNKIDDYEEIDWSDVVWKDYKTIPGDVAIGDMDDLERMGPETFIQKLKRHVKTLDKIIAASPKPVKLVTRKWQLAFKVDLTGWKYLSRVRAAGPQALKRALSIYPSVIVTARMGDDNAAAWYPVQRRIEVELSTLDRISLDYAKELRRTVRHEMRHFAQDFLGRVVGAEDKAGLPSKKIRTPDMEQSYGREKKYKRPPSVQKLIDNLEKKGITKDIFHDLDDVEFYTVLGRSLELMGDNLPHFEPDKRKAAFLSFVGAGPKVPGAYPLQFMTSLKKYAPGKWKKAVSELAKELL